MHATLVVNQSSTPATTTVFYPDADSRGELIRQVQQILEGLTSDSQPSDFQEVVQSLQGVTTWVIFVRTPDRMLTLNSRGDQTDNPFPQ